MPLIEYRMMQEFYDELIENVSDVRISDRIVEPADRSL